MSDWPNGIISSTLLLLTINLAEYFKVVGTIVMIEKRGIYLVCYLFKNVCRYH